MLTKDCLAMNKQKERQLNLHANSKGCKIRSSGRSTVKTFYYLFLYKNMKLVLRNTKAIWMHVICLNKIMA